MWQTSDSDHPNLRSGGPSSLFLIAWSQVMTTPSIFLYWGHLALIPSYYIDTSVLLENIPLVKSIKTTTRDPSGLFSIISHVIYRWRNFSNFPLLFYRCLFVYIIKRTLHGGAKIWILFSRGKTIFYERAQRVSKILFCHSKIKFISSRHRVISSLYITNRIHTHFLISCSQKSSNWTNMNINISLLKITLQYKAWKTASLVSVCWQRCTESH